ncbi:hypothetical protein Vadar_011063 [Vaccinium darrowii]|uniref:Uncharacterized protein n=1 Tax=Vaccinium darrowii TaxID=229202 RepID=A0ACB7YF52_9ERIC|nr:hypothetical protein Vadar_011063 [Vaccinium darrowii]
MEGLVGSESDTVRRKRERERETWNLTRTQYRVAGSSCRRIWSLSSTPTKLRTITSLPNLAVDSSTATWDEAFNIQVNESRSSVPHHCSPPLAEEVVFRLDQISSKLPGGASKGSETRSKSSGRRKLMSEWARRWWAALDGSNDSSDGLFAFREELVVELDGSCI